MSDVHTLPAPILPDQWAGVDTSIDAETPEILSEDQLDRYAATVASLLGALGWKVETTVSCDGAQLDITNPNLGFDHTLELIIRDDRSAEWRLDAGDDLLEGTPALELATRIATLLPGSPRE